MRVFNKYALFADNIKYYGEPDPLGNSKWYRFAHMHKSENYAVKYKAGILFSDKDWESECTEKEYHLMHYAKKARIRKKYRNRIERRI